MTYRCPLAKSRSGWSLGHHTCVLAATTAAGAATYLQDCARPACQAPVQALKERLEPLARLVAAAVGVAQPLHRADADGAVEAALPQRHALAHVPQQHITLHLQTQDCECMS
eukprot:GHRQ01031120.1.p1 GENE.GHRQ01031120.1~~GHRQ01031120.1.p1  ORF type:complete len:112 (+),score=16.29 GHRQ01031120.1:753-1088(+)